MATSLTPITGTANVTNDSTTVEVVGMALSALNCADGAQVFLAGLGYFVSGGPTDTTHFELERPYEGTTGTVSCSIGQVTPEMTQRIALARAIAGFDASAQLIAANQAGLSYSYTGSTAAPISGQVALDNADPASATAINFNEADLSQQSVADRLGQIAAGDQLTIRAIDGSARVSYIASGAPVDEGSYQQVAVTYLGSAGVLAAGAQVVVERLARGPGWAPIAIPGGDYNQATAPGAYAGAGGAAINGPPGNGAYGTLFVAQRTAAVITQLAIFSQDAGAALEVYARGSGNDGVFSAWGRLLTEKDIGSAVQGYDALLQSIAGLTGANGDFLAVTGAATAAMRAIVGTVSQSAGVPTGAIVETGGNANGSYVRYADGTQRCRTVQSFSLATGTAQTNTWTFPAAFVDANAICNANGFRQGGGVGSVSVIATVASQGNVTGSSMQYIVEHTIGSTQIINVMITAEGRWF
jgi:hypothetical protein